MDLFSFLLFHFMCVTVTVVIGHSVALSRHSHLFSTMSSLHDNFNTHLILRPPRKRTLSTMYAYTKVI
jgi:hypothetical protein